MQIPVKVTFKGMEPSAAVDAKIRQELDKLERYSDRITGCRVTIEEPQRRRHQGNLFQIRIDLTLPGGELLVQRNPAEHHAHEDVYVAIRDAFDAARRQLQNHTRRQRLDVKAHEDRAGGRMVRLFDQEDLGSDGRASDASLQEEE